MDIFVRSQNNKIIAKMGEMHVVKDDNGEWIIVHSGGAILGYYESEERCQAVLKHCCDCAVNYAELGKTLMVYNMPKE